MKSLSAILTLSCLSLGASAACGAPCSLYTLAWEEEFDSTAVNTTAWNFRTDQKALSAQLAANVGQADDNLIINLKKQTVNSYSYTGGGVISKPKFHYGYFESRIRMNYGKGWHTSFWLMAGDGSTTFDVASHTHSEIDIFERDSTTNSTLSHNINLWKADSTRQTNYGSGALSTAYQFPQWHVFGALWNETHVVFYIDGVQSAALSFLPSKWTHDYLNIWLTSLAYGVTPDDTKLPSKIESSYVRYYQKDIYLTSGNLCFAHAQGDAACGSNKGYKEIGSSWSTSSLTGYTVGLSTRYSCSVGGAKASWSIESAPVSGTYEIWVWVIARSDSDASASYQVLKDSTSALETTVDQTSGSARWVRLSSGLATAQGQKIDISLSASGSGCARADTVKLVRTA
ncbi:hypothetical protein QQZ08_006197 [Neonectria magnoliae]|uniref:GH16 domain-containing protein n=1 Tax=Neonectria magnoliae TaxID=2732573 RepID=A0ABR1I305_9HYPO